MSATNEARNPRSTSRHKVLGPFHMRRIPSNEGKDRAITAFVEQWSQDANSVDAKQAFLMLLDTSMVEMPEVWHEAFGVLFTAEPIQDPQASIASYRDSGFRIAAHPHVVCSVKFRSVHIEMELPLLVRSAKSSISKLR